VKNPLCGIAIFMILLVCAACAPRIDFAHLATQPTPAAWASASTWRFAILDRDGSPQGDIVMELTDEITKTCSDGKWKRARFKGGTFTNLPLAGWYGKQQLHPAYVISGQSILMQLNAPLCDNDIVLRGALTATGASGTFQSEAMFGGEKYGLFSATPGP